VLLPGDRVSGATVEGVLTCGSSTPLKVRVQMTATETPQIKSLLIDARE
jgi:hypothetical protein